MTEKKKTHVPTESETMDAEHLIYDCMELNKVPVPVALSACFNIISCSLQMKGVSPKSIESYINAFRACIEQIGGFIEVVRKEPHEKPSQM